MPETWSAVFVLVIHEKMWKVIFYGPLNEKKETHMEHVCEFHQISGELDG